MKKMKIVHTLFTLSTLSLLVGCAPMSHPINLGYSPDTYVRADATASDEVASRITVPTDRGHLQGVLTSASFTRSPELMKAYKTYMRTGNAKAIRGNGFITLPYNRYKRPIMQCAPLQVCQIVLEKNEIPNGVSLGDSMRWKVDKMYEGVRGNGSWVIILKPTALHIATNLMISTNKRIYNFGLVSKQGESPVVNFWYPHDMVQMAKSAAEIAKANARLRDQDTISQRPALNGTVLNTEDLNFNYIRQGDTPPWTPTQVFDDGNKTFIRMPPATDRTALPVLFVYRNKQQALVNYRYKRPYMIVDGLFAKAALISGKGDNKVEVDIINKNRMKAVVRTDAASQW